jgi:hypothetical protein
MWHESDYAGLQPESEPRLLAAYSFAEIVQLADTFGMSKEATKLALQREANYRIQEALENPVTPVQVPLSIEGSTAQDIQGVGRELGVTEWESNVVIRSEISRRADEILPGAGRVALQSYEQDSDNQRVAAIRRALISLSLTPKLEVVPTGDEAAASLLLERTLHGLSQPEVIALLGEEDQISVSYYSRLETGERDTASYIYKFTCLVENGAYEAAAQRKKATVGSKPEVVDNEQA